MIAPTPAVLRSSIKEILFLIITYSGSSDKFDRAQQHRQNNVHKGEYRFYTIPSDSTLLPSCLVDDC